MRPAASSPESPVRHLVPLASPPALQLPQTGFLRERQVLTFVPVSKSTLWRWVQSGYFPAPVKLSAHVTAWRAEDVRRWIQEEGRPAAA